MQQAITNGEQLLDRLGLSHLAPNLDANNPFPIRLPDSYLHKMRHGDATDPLLLQVLPQLIENDSSGSRHPVHDLDFMQVPGLLHKYHGRALLITTGACAIHCRYCFRRHYPYAEASTKNNELEHSLRYLQQHPEIDEIILSGGDPLMLSDARLSRLIAQLDDIAQLRFLRIHTRIPVVLPSRVNDALIEILSRTRLKVCVVVHSNHANEICVAEQHVFERLRGAGMHLLNQSVLLKGINDSVDTLVKLSKKLYENDVLPYYLHMLDPVQGAMHFAVSESRASKIIDGMRGKLPGYLVPRLVREIPNSPSKSAISGI